jgi:hypothetical protein
MHIDGKKKYWNFERKLDWFERLRFLLKPFLRISKHFENMRFSSKRRAYHKDVLSFQRSTKL